MGKLWGAKEIAELIGICEETLCTWEKRHYIPTASRQGLTRKRVWSEWKLERILAFAKDNGYQVPYQVVMTGGHTGETKTKERSGYQLSSS